MDLFVIRLATNLQYARLDPWTTCADLGWAGLTVERFLCSRTRGLWSRRAYRDSSSHHNCYYKAKVVEFLRVFPMTEMEVCQLRFNQEKVTFVAL